MAGGDSSKKRKRREGAGEGQAADFPAGKVVVQVDETPSGSAGPAMAAFSTVKPPTSTKFSVYTSVDPSASDILAGETDRMEYFSDPTSHSPASCSYMLGTFSPSTSKLTIIPAPLHIMSTRVKALKNLAPIVSSTAHANAAARATLGTAFGTKKAQRAIRTAERNQIDPDSMKHVQDHLMSAITTNSAALPSKEEVQAVADAARPIPPFNLEAKSPKDVYDLSGIVSFAELQSLPINAILQASRAKDAIALLPARPDWIKTRMETTWKAHPSGQLDKKQLKKLRILVYISYLFAARGTGSHWAFGTLKKRLSQGKRSKSKSTTADPDADPEAEVKEEDAESTRYTPCPDNVLEGLLSRYTETPQNSTRAMVTTFYANKLLSYLACLCLIYDNFACEMGSLAADLQMDRKKLQETFKSLGCTIDKPSATDQQRLLAQAKEEGRSGQEALSGGRVARLKVPLKFPVPKRGKKTR